MSATRPGFCQDLRAELAAKNENRLHMFHASASNCNWPWIFGTSRILPPTAFLAVRCLFAAIFLGILIANLTQTLDKGMWFIYLTKWSFFLETIYLCLAAYVTYRARTCIVSDDARPISEDVPERLPWYVNAMYLLWLICMTVVLVICIAFWTLIDPIWHLTADMGINYSVIFMHFLNALFFIAEFVLNRNAFHLKHGVAALPMYVAMYTIWSLVHFACRIGLPPQGACNNYALRDCPIYPVLDWHHPVKALVVVFALSFLTTVLMVCIWRITRIRDCKHSINRVGLAALSELPY